MRRPSASLAAALAVLATCLTSLLLAAGALGAGTTYTPEAPTLDSVSGGPWNASQGDSSAGSAYPGGDLLPTYVPGGSQTSLGGLEEPNLAVYPTGVEGATVPYPSGVAGTPGPLDGYCSKLGANPETGSPVPQPAGSLPMSPYYFPDVVRNADGSLTGYFDYRPKDAEEAITVAKSTDNGESWTTEGKALGQNSGYCPTADDNDDGQGHPYVTGVDGAGDLYTLQRPAGDNTGIGLLVHHVEQNASDPLAGLSENEPVGVDPNTYAEGEVSVPTSGEGVSIPVSTLGSAGSPEQIVAGPYEDANAPSPSGSIITCANTSATPSPALTGCTVAGGSPLTVRPKDNLLQVIAKAETNYTIPVSPNKPNGEGGLETLKFLYGNATVSPITTYLMNLNAPNRIYIDGAAVYCSQANANPTTKLEFCTTTNGTPLSVHTGDAITADPIVPPGATMTTGLQAPDGIVGTLPKYPGAPEGAKVVLYTQKVLSYFIVGTTDGPVEAGKFKAGTIKLSASTFTINYKPSVTESEPLPASGTFKIYLGTEVGQPIQTVTCKGVGPAPAGSPAGSEDLTECSGGTGSVKEGNWIGGPNAAIAPYSALEQIGEGTNSKSKGPEKLFGNNEDLTVLRAAWTENGTEFHDLGAISGSTSGAGNDSGEYNDISNPLQTTSPSATSPSNVAAGSPDTDELRFVGSRGTIVTNPDGSYGMFLSGAWATDGDSDAFNQIFYSESSNGKEWSVPKVVLSTEYQFNASREQDEALKNGIDAPLGISAYYSGRAYGPAVVQNPDGSLTMMFSGYRIPKPVVSAGTKLGTNSTEPYLVGEKDPTLYRDILTMHLASATSPGVATSTTVSSSDEGKGLVSQPVTYTATVAPVSPGTGTPTGSVSFSNASGPIAGCQERPLGLSSPDTATCATTHAAQPGSEEITASYSGDTNYAGSSGTADENVQEAPAIVSANSATVMEGSELNFKVAVTGSPTPSVTKEGTLPHGVSFDESTDTLSGTPTQEGEYKITFTASNGVGANAAQSFTLTVEAPPKITSPAQATFEDHTPSSFVVSATGTPAPKIAAWGSLPAGVSYEEGLLYGTPTQTGTYELTFFAANGIGAESIQQFTLTVLGLHVTTSSLPVATPGTPYSVQLRATGGLEPYKWKLTEKGLPKGLKLSSTGVISGTVSARQYPSGGSFPIMVTVTDSTKKSHQRASGSLTVDVS